MQCTQIYYLNIATWNVRTLYKAGAMNELVQSLKKYNIDKCVLQGIRWPGSGILTKKYYTVLYSGQGTS